MSVRKQICAKVVYIFCEKNEACHRPCLQSLLPFPYISITEAYKYARLKPKTFAPCAKVEKIAKQNFKL